MFALVSISLGIVIFAAIVVRRLAGIRRGKWLRTCAAVTVGEAAGIATLQAVTGDILDLGLPWVAAGCALVAVFSMLALVIIDMLVATRPARRFALPRPGAAVRRSRRYLQVSLIAVRRGLLRGGSDSVEDSGSRLGRALAGTFDEAGGLFVKLGQAMAGQPQLVTAPVAAELSKLQNQAAPADPGAALSVLEQELGPLDEVFATFDREPLAAASVAQTYRGTLHDGRRVVIKVQRPGVDISMQRDLDILSRLADRLERQTVWASSLGLIKLVAGFSEATREELDFRIEAANSAVAQRALTPTDPIMIPAIMDEFTTRRVLIQEHVDGPSVAASKVLDSLTPERRRELADALLSLQLRQMIGGERFHADPHAGNVLLAPDGRLALIDFGSVGRLNHFEQAGLIDIFRGLQSEDPHLLRQAALQLGTPSVRLDAEALDREMARLLVRNLDRDTGLNPRIFGDIIVVFRDFDIELPRSTTILFRTILTALGTLEVLSPGYDVRNAFERLGEEISASIVRPGQLREAVRTVAPVIARLPRDVDDVARALLRGEIRTRVSLLSEAEDVRVLRSLVNRVVLGLLSSAIVIASAMLLAAPPVVGQTASLVRLIGGVGLGFGSLLLLRLVMLVSKD